MAPTFSRREWFQLSACSTFSAILPLSAESAASDFKTYWGDLHNHNSVGYAQGSLRRSFEIARNHLDFFAFTPHAWWPDIGHYENNIEKKWLDGFRRTRELWPEVLQMVREFDEPGKFVPIAGYEWHSTAFGDYHILFPYPDAELKLFDDLKEFQHFARQQGCILVPHHPANHLGHRGVNMSVFDTRVSPVMEIYSEWGNAESDRGPFPYIRHSEGGRWTRNTAQYLLAQGYRFGFVASTDDHLGYPGAYREGLAAVKATELTRDAIFDALRHRRTYAVTGDRIGLEFFVNGHIMGEEIPYVRERQLSVKVTGWDQVERVELIKNNVVIHRDFPVDRPISNKSWSEPVLICFEYGWGPWAALGAASVCDWDFEIRLERGVLEDVQQCFQSGPFDENRRDRILDKTLHSVRVQSFTARRDQFEDIANKAVVLKVRGGPDTQLSVSLKTPSHIALRRSLRELAESGETLFTGSFPKESALIHRLVFRENYHTEYTVRDVDDGVQTSWYYVRVTQSNGQLAWSSPVWVERVRSGRAGPK